MRLVFVFVLFVVFVLVQDVENLLQLFELWDDMWESVIGINQELLVDLVVFLFDVFKCVDNFVFVLIYIIQLLGVFDVIVLLLVVDGNFVLVVVEFIFGKVLMLFDFEVWLCVDIYLDVCVIVMLVDGCKVMVGCFVCVLGGCVVFVGKSMDQVCVIMGEMWFCQVVEGGCDIGMLMICYFNFLGLQCDQVMLLIIFVEFIQMFEVK